MSLESSSESVERRPKGLAKVVSKAELVLEPNGRAASASDLYFYRNKSLRLEAELARVQVKLTAAKKEVQDLSLMSGQIPEVPPAPMISGEIYDEVARLREGLDIARKQVERADAGRDLILHMFGAASQGSDVEAAAIRAALSGGGGVKARLGMSSVIGKIKASGIFDSERYLESYPDVRSAGVSALVHYASNGWRELRRPHPLFDLQWYFVTYVDLLKAKVEPLSHYATQGFKEDRNPNRLFNAKWYRHKYSTEMRANESPLAHYIRVGADQDFWPHPLFDPIFYSETYGVRYASHKWQVLEHYLKVGMARGYRPSRYFDPMWYASAYPDSLAQGRTPVEDYMLSPQSRLRRPAAEFDVDAYVAERPGLDPATMNPLSYFYHGGDVQM